MSFLLSVIQSLLVPKLLGVEQYGYWQLFGLYSSYVGFFHLGLNDGVYLLNGGETREHIDRSSIKSQLIFAILTQTILASLLLIIVCMSDLGPERQFVLTCTGIYLVVQNAASYLMLVLQALNETKKSSISTIINKLIYLLPLLWFFINGIDSFVPFVISYIIAATVQFLYCAWCCKDILSARVLSPAITASESWESILVGSKLMLANIASSLIVGALRLVIDSVWGIKTFGKLSLTFSIVYFFLAFVSQAAMVLFPALRQSSKEEVRVFFCVTRDTMGVLLPCLFLFYYPVSALLCDWLPAYAESARYLVWLIPICLFDSQMNIVCTTMFKVMRQEGILLTVNMLTLIASAITVAISAFLLGSIELCIASATASIAVRSIVSEKILARHLCVPSSSTCIGEVLLVGVFTATTCLLNPAPSILIYVVAYAVHLVYHRDVLRRMKGVLRKIA